MEVMPTLLEYPQVGEVFLAEGHPKADTFQARRVLAEAFQLFMVHEVYFFFAALGEIEGCVDTGEGRFLSVCRIPAKTKPRCVISRMLISGLKLVAKALP